jgi:hypothetical protein
VNKRLVRALLVAAFACAGPMALVIDLVARHFVVGSQPAEVQQFLADHVTPLAWAIVPGPLLGGLLGFFRYPVRYAKGLARAAKDPSTSPADAEERADMEALFVGTTLAQLPALLGDFSVMLGARLAPALCATSISVVAVVLIGTFARRRIPR